MTHDRTTLNRMKLKPLQLQQRKATLLERLSIGAKEHFGVEIGEEDFLILTALAEKVSKGTLLKWEKENIELQNSFNAFLNGLL